MTAATHARRSIPPTHRQRGAILIVSLLMLLVLTLLALATMRAATFEERMAGNARDVNLSFQSAEAALRAAEDAILALDAEPLRCLVLDATCDLQTAVAERGVVPAAVRPLPWNTVAVPSGTGRGGDGGDGAGTVDNVAGQPRVVVEHYETLDGPLMDADDEVRLVYRVIARGVGGTDTAQTILESTLTRYPY
ncbi:MAG: PilX N-terminal domain-containing pilus assembly protein [Pseudomonadota bacterium]